MYNRYFLKLIVTLLQLLRLKSIQQFSFLDLNQYSNNNNQVSVQKFWGWLQILNKLVRVDHMYSFPPFYFILIVISFSLLLLRSSFFRPTICLYLFSFPQHKSTHFFSLVQSLSSTYAQTVSSNSNSSFHKYGSHLSSANFLISNPIYYTHFMNILLLKNPKFSTIEHGQSYNSFRKLFL